MSYIDTALGPKMCNLLKTGNTNGAALVHVLYTILRSASKRMLLSKGRMASVKTSCQGILNCLPRSFKCCPGCATIRFLVCVTTLGKVPGGITGGHIARLLRIISLDRITGGGMGAFSNNVGREMKVTRTLLGGPGVLVLSRPATKLSPGRHIHFHGLLSRCTNSGVMVLSARVMSSVRTVTSRILLVGGKGFMLRNAIPRLVRGTGNGI